MIKTINENERVIALDHIGTFSTPTGTYKVLVVTIKTEAQSITVENRTVTRGRPGRQP